MVEDNEALIVRLINQIQSASSKEELERLRLDLIGKKGLISSQFSQLKSANLEQQKEKLKRLNKLKSEAITNIENKKQLLLKEQLNKQITNEWYDITLPGTPKKYGKIHPLTKAKHTLLSILAKLGFQHEEGPNIDDEWHNFSALNMPQHHPARQMFDTFYIKDHKVSCDNRKLLRTHTSTVQIRVMSKDKPPFRFISAGKVYRKDMDATHIPMFHQIEGVVVEKDFSLAHMKSVLYTLLREFFEQDIQIRLRPSYFPFTSPSAEIDLKLPQSDKWLEVLGTGVIHPAVLQNVGINNSQWFGCAFGLGIERLAMLKYHIPDLRHMVEGHISWLQNNGFSMLEI
ncbi:phenylalanine--tRNA ligase subunit alpha [Candidatus Sneabacter namystus]|uniref:Phenylalanine--tRNA ligase alpha subunit n=1 Tax=Candidatus Sneabacter namystus TaxID=2601646 RepID=A0A5C0UH70_9RICK|nr:phenylalanine--tRNA ligase subunit alpha [Candidatus Sneabacter namystus]QEK39458.1 phenylalanine--tRNA ligase subunit alpha [Candidatus Sneabacter namystus]